jgi:hypothetical protein
MKHAFPLALVLWLLGSVSPAYAQGADSAAWVQLAIDSNVSTRTCAVGQVVHLHATEPTTVDGREVPAGTPATGIVTVCHRPGRLHRPGALVVDRIALVDPAGAAFAVSEDVVSGESAGPARWTPESDLRVRGTILEGIAAGYAGAWLASQWSHSEETVAGAGIATGVGSIVAITLLQHGPHAELRSGTIVELRFSASRR